MKSLIDHRGSLPVWERQTETIPETIVETIVETISIRDEDGWVIGFLSVRINPTEGVWRARP